MEKEEMRIGVISDTHGSLKSIDRAIAAAGRVELWLHAGDYSQDAPYLEKQSGVPVYAVCGNCDVYENRGPVEVVTKLEDFTIAMVHGNRYVSGSHFDRLIYWAEEKKADVVVFGHIHIPVNEEVDGILVINPAGQQEEQTYYETIIGLKGEFLFADTMQEARLKIITEQGYLPVDVIGEQVWFDTTVSRIPLTRNGQPVKKTYCAFWKKDNSGYYVEEFAELLKNRF